MDKKKTGLRERERLNKSEGEEVAKSKQLVDTQKCQQKKRLTTKCVKGTKRERANKR
jgi:hypothetical protein